ncbi:MAG: acyl-CoA thioesterase [Pseudomonadales bacterium]|nr:acyl-CoA thioesterase [Pseudomonadales bacterium]
MSGWDHPHPFLHAVRVQHAHIDVLEHANNIAYVGWCQDAAWRHSAALGLAPDAYRALDRAMVVRKAQYEYLLAAVADDELEVGTWLTGSDGRLQMRRHFQVRRGADGATLLRGDWDLVCIRISTGKPVRMPPVFLDSYLPAVIGNSGAGGGAAG